MEAFQLRFEEAHKITELASSHTPVVWGETNETIAPVIELVNLTGVDCNVQISYHPFKSALMMEIERIPHAVWLIFSLKKYSQRESGWLPGIF